MTPMQESSLLAIPPELRLVIYEEVISSSRTPEHYTTLKEAFKQQPGFLNTCRQLRREALPVYFADTNLLISVREPEISRFKALLQDFNQSFLSSLRRLSFEIPCCGFPEMSTAYLATFPHSMVFDIELGDTKWKAVERHGYWVKRDNQWFFTPMRRHDVWGLEICNVFGSIPVESGVEAWKSVRFAKDEVLRLIEQICEHPRVAPRLQAQSQMTTLFGGKS